MWYKIYIVLDGIRIAAHFVTVSNYSAVVRTYTVNFLTCFDRLK